MRKHITQNELRFLNMVCLVPLWNEFKHTANGSQRRRVTIYFQTQYSEQEASFQNATTV